MPQLGHMVKRNFSLLLIKKQTLSLSEDEKESEFS